tara:strand:- start:1291 stop:1950 length:660 start_codon:yes stop_codon:yes gene_type:complete
METHRIAILVPAYNEEGTIASVIKGAIKYGEVFVVDDGSTDTTASVAKESGATVLSSGSNLGYDSALAFGYQSLIPMGFFAIITMDADGQHIHSDIPKFIDSLRKGCDAVIGSRPSKARAMERVFGLIVFSLWRIEDPLCGMKGYTVRLLIQKPAIATYKSVGTELLMFALASGLKVESVNIQSRDRIDQSRFAGAFRSNALILSALLIGIAKTYRWSK